MASSIPNTKTRPSTPSNSTVASLRKRLEGLENQVKRINANRTPEPTLVHQLSNAGPMSQVQDGQGLIYNAATGQYEPGIQHGFVLGNTFDNFPSNDFYIICNGGGGYTTLVTVNAGVLGGGSGQSIFTVFCEATGDTAELSIGQGPPSIGRFFADSLNFGGAIVSGSSPPLGAGSMAFFGYPVVNQPTVTGSKGGNAALASLLAALSTAPGGLGLLVDAST